MGTISTEFFTFTESKWNVEENDKFYWHTSDKVKLKLMKENVAVSL